jgi:hypothetical protein
MADDPQNNEQVDNPVNTEPKEPPSNESKNSTKIDEQNIYGRDTQVADKINNYYFDRDDSGIDKRFGISGTRDNELIQQKVRRDISAYKVMDEISETAERLIKDNIICLAQNQGEIIWCSSSLHSLLIYLEDNNGCDYYYNRTNTFNLDNYLQSNNNFIYGNMSVAYINRMDKPREVESIFQSEYFKDIKAVLKNNNLFLIIVLPFNFIEKYRPKNQILSESIYCWIPKEKNDYFPEEVKILPEKPEEFIVKFLLAFFPGLDHAEFLYLFEKLLSEVANPINNTLDTKLSNEVISPQIIEYQWKENIDNLIETQQGYYFYNKDIKSEQRTGFYFSDPNMSVAIFESFINRRSIRVRNFSDVLINIYLFDNEFRESITPSYHLFLKVLHDTGLREIDGNWLAEKFCSSFESETKDFTWIRVEEFLEFLRFQALDEPVDDAIERIVNWAVFLEGEYLEKWRLSLDQELPEESRKFCGWLFHCIRISAIIMLLVQPNSKNVFDLLLKFLAGHERRNNKKLINSYGLDNIYISCIAFNIQIEQFAKDEYFLHQFLENISKIFYLPKIDSGNMPDINTLNTGIMLLQSKENRFFAAAVFLRSIILSFYYRAWGRFLLDDSEKKSDFIKPFYGSDENPWQDAKVFFPILHAKVVLYGNATASNKINLLPDAIEDIAIQLELMISVRWKMDGKMMASKTDASEKLIKIFCKDLKLHERTRVKQILSFRREWYRREKTNLNSRSNAQIKDYRRRIEVLTRVLSIFDKSLKKAIEV